MTDKQKMVTEASALPGRDSPVTLSGKHFVNHTDLTAERPEGCEEVLFGLGCFWGAERVYWQLEGVVSTSVGYSGGFTPNPTYEEVCTGRTGHTEVVRVVYDPGVISLSTLLNCFWEKHDPTQGMRQGNDLGTQYRSAIYTFSDAQLDEALKSKHLYQDALNSQLSGHPSSDITTEIAAAGPYYLAEEYHQQYLAKNPQGYCGIGGTGVCFPE